MKPRPLEKPSVDQCCLVRTVIIEDEMDVKFLRDAVVNEIKEFFKLHGAMATKTTPGDFSGRVVERGNLFFI